MQIHGHVEGNSVMKVHCLGWQYNDPCKGWNISGPLKKTMAVLFFLRPLNDCCSVRVGVLLPFFNFTIIFRYFTNSLSKFLLLSI